VSVIEQSSTLTVVTPLGVGNWATAARRLAAVSA
jgi:hypothetical protein